MSRLSPIFLKKPALVCLLLFLCLLQGNRYAHAESSHLLINPQRIIFVDRERTVNVTVGNPTNVPVSYSISLVTMRRNAKGEYIEIFESADETENETLAKRLIRFAPRRATVQPRTRQVVKLMVRKPADLPPGEYRTRLRIMPKPQHPPQKISSGDDSGTRQFKLDLLVGVSLPIIVQHGKSTVNVSPTTISIKPFAKTDSGLAAELSLGRTGNLSAFGDVILQYMASNGEQREIGRVRGTAIYLPKTKGKFTIPLKGITEKELSSGSIEVVYTAYRGQSRRNRKAPPMVRKTFRL